MNSGNGPERTPRSRQKGQLLFDWSKSGDAPVPSPLPQPDVHESANGAPDGQALPPALSYPPGHPWHYYRLGGNAAPMPVDAIPPATGIEHTFDRELPKPGPKRIVKARELLHAERRGLEADRQRYQAIVERGADALSRYDREIAHGGDLGMARASALALTFNHVAWRLGRIAVLERELSRSNARGR
jgi:hypothetical protein